MYIYTNQRVSKRFSNTSNIIIKMMLKLIPTFPIKKRHQTCCENTSKTIIPNTPHFQILAPILEQFAWLFRPVVRCFSRPVFWNLWGGTPLDRCWSPLGHSDFVDCLEDCSCNFAKQFKDFKASNGTNHTFNKKTSKESNNYC